MIKPILTLIITVVITLAMAQVAHAAEWYNTSWKYRQKVTISSSMADSDQTNFPALIKITDATNPLFSNAQSDGDDILFTKSDGTTKLSHEIEKYSNTGTKELDAWVKIPTLSGSSDTVIYMYYGNASASNQQDTTNVWDSNYKGVWHLSETGSNPQVLDSTSNDNDSDSNDADPTTSGEINGAMDFTAGNSDYVDVGDDDTLTPVNMTISTWAKLVEDSGTLVMVMKDHEYVLQAATVGDDFEIGVSFSGTTFNLLGSNADPSDYINEWHFYTMTWTGNNLSFYIDGEIDKSTTSYSGTIQNTNNNLGIGVKIVEEGGLVNYFDGTIDEVRISSVARSADWIGASYNNQNSPSTYLSTSSQEYNGNPGRVTDSVTEQPIKGASVTLYTASGSIYTGRAQPNPTQTDAGGYYQLEADPGRYYLTATKEGYEDYKSGLFTVSSPVNEPITMVPLDQSRGSYFSIINQVDKKVASIGDVLTYKITVANLSSSAASSVSVSASLPHDFRLAKGTVKIDGVNQNDPGNLKGPTFSLDPIANGSSKTITYRAIVGADAKVGKNKNYATVTGTISGTSHSQGPAVATVDIREGVFSSLGMLIGKVYHDINGNGVQDTVSRSGSTRISTRIDAEPGIPGVAVILDDGTTVITDKYGRYSVPEISSGMHAVRLDQRVLPGGPFYKEKPETRVQKPEPLIERRSLGDWIKDRLGKGDSEIRRLGTGDLETGGLGTGTSQSPNHLIPHYRTDIPEVTRFVNIPETTTGKLDFPIELLTPKEEELLKKKHKKITQFMAIGTFDGRVGSMNIKGNIQNFKDGNPTEFVGGEFPDNIYQDGRIVLYLKGLMKGKYLLTMRYDSTKNNEDHLYKYINPERYYPVYGDNSILTNDADSQGPLFIKIERERSFAEIGNYSTEEFEATQLARYNRVLHGVKVHYRTEDFEAADLRGYQRGSTRKDPPSPRLRRAGADTDISVNQRLDPRESASTKIPAPKLHLTTFVANTTQEETEDTFAGLGISGPFYLTKTPILEYTERIRIETRDKNKSDTILNTTYLARDRDYNIEYDNGRIFFHKPIPSRNENDDPVYIVVRYEYSANTDLDYDIMGNRLEAYLFPRKDGPHQLMLAGQTINEQKDLYNWGMYSVDGILHLTPNVRLLAEYARSEKSQEEYGQAVRAEIEGKFFKDKLRLQAYATEINEDFFNPVNVTESGVQKYGGLGQFYITDNISIIGDSWFSRSMAAHTYDRQSTLDIIAGCKNIFLSAGYRLKEYVDQDNVTKDTQTHQIETSQALALRDNIILSNTISYEMKYTHDYPSDPDLDYDMDIFTASPRIDIKMDDYTSLYARHDVSNGYDSNTTTVGLSRLTPEGIRSYVEYGFTGQGTNTTTIGQEANMSLTDRMTLKSYMNTKITPYHTTENIGYNSRIKIVDDLFGNFAFERNKVANGQTPSDYNAQSASLEYITEENTAGAKFEHRDENDTTRYNLFANASFNLAESTRVLGKGEYSWKRDKDTKETQEDYKRALLGIAHRPVHCNNLNFFGKYEYKENLYQDATIPLDTIQHIGSVEGIYEPYKWLEVSGKYAIKHYTEASDNLTTPSLTDMFTIRPSLKLNKYIDITGIYRYLRNHDIKTTKQLASLEAGVTVFDHLRVAAGYNFTRYDDKYLPDEDYKGYGPYLHMTYKFLDDTEKILESRKEMLKRFADESALELYKISQIPGDEKFVEEVKACYTQAMKWYKFGKYEEALECLQQGMEAYYAARRYAENAEVKNEAFLFYLTQGEKYHKYGLKNKAFASLEKAYEINAYDKKLLELMSKVRDEIKEDWIKRRKVLVMKREGIEKIAKSEDDTKLVLETVKLHLKIGKEFYSMGDYEGAIGEWKEGIAIAKRAREDYLDLKEEREILVKELESIYSMARLHWKREDYISSKKELERALNLISKTLE